ncbi:phage portal protein [Leptospira licerasiae]|uniref:Phage portal-like protein n=1 Tax=Leptospira licerasiae str. MMD4847 TaxID=1049971 RepID=A0ABN0H9M8_9LEPT|nr:phage portal protein [Leptospira licerasiae]EIE01439.1 phage portal-like protein [Leptospira licerasiae serovar Varillal str. VAR 010]EJZ42256.1 phage portal-like protein [Leptospira licerasiae str. MMD4847]
MGNPGRPRGKDYQKNLEKRLRLSNPKQTSSANNIQPSIINERLLHLAKSFFNSVNTESVAGRLSKNPTYTYQQYQNIQEGVLLRPIWRIPYEILRNASYGTSIISAIHTVRVDGLSRFARISKKEGLWFRMEDEDEEVTDEVLERMKACGKWFERMGDLVDGWNNRDHFFPVFEMMIRDTLTLDSTAFWLIRNALGKLVEIRYLDPATIYPVDPKLGYRGDKSVAFVQMIENTVVETFTSSDLLWNHKNHISDVQMRGFGFSPLEACMLDLTGVINTLKFNRDRFTRQPPAGFLSVLGDLSPETIESLELQWQEMISGMDDSHKIPILGTSAGEVSWTPLNLPNDMVFKDFIQWLVSFVLMGHGMDAAEVGLHLINSPGISEANPKDKIKMSISRSEKALLTSFEHTLGNIKEFRNDVFPGIVPEFAGKDPEDEKDKIARWKEEVTNIKLIDEIRRANDLPLIGDTLADLYGVDPEQYKMSGALILNPTYQQYFGQIKAQSEMNSNSGEEEFGENGEYPSEEENYNTKEEDFDMEPDYDLTF